MTSESRGRIAGGIARRQARTCRRSEQTTEQRRPAWPAASPTARAVLASVAATVTAAICLLTATAATGQPSVFSAASGDGAGKRPGDWSALTRSTVRQQVAARSVPALASAAGASLMSSAPAELMRCEEDPTFLCTTVPVPLDRRHPDGRMVNLHVEVFPHTGPQADADGAVFVTCGGPGCSISSGPKYGFALFALAETAQTRDLVFMDQRGVGLSDVTDCPGLQAGDPFTLYEDVAACHDQLGADSDLYSTTDVADDLEDVRLALGYEKIDLFGGSYAGADMMTYAVRHGEHVRSATLASPAVLVGLDPFYPYAPEAMTQIAAKMCARSPACAAANPKPAWAFADIARELRRHPVHGTGIDSAGGSHDNVTVNENRLANFIMYFNGAHFTGPGEIIPAMAAHHRGDDVPLLRLGADTDPINFGAPLREFSNGHSWLRSCVDGEFPFDKTAGPLTRAAQFARAYAREPAFYGDISKQAWAQPGFFGFQPSPCIVRRWQDRPLYPAGTRVKGIPTLVLGGEYDMPVPESVSKLATKVMTDSRYVGISAAGHDPQFWGPCGSELTQRFIDTLNVGDTSCASQRAGGWWVPGVFARHAAGLPAATQTGGPPASLSTRRLVTAAAWTVMDSIQHNFFVPGDSVALRGGVVDFEGFEDHLEWRLGEARFTEDVTVNGTVTWFIGPPGGNYGGEFEVTGPAGQTTVMQIGGPFLTDGEQMTISFDGATFTVPAY